MRGYDAVSFVFGLEVTWGKIQQRQQEEEDREAMRELEQIEELQKSLKEAVQAESENNNVDDELPDDSMKIDDATAISENNNEEFMQVTESDVDSPSANDSTEIDVSCEGGTPEAQIICSSSSDIANNSSYVEVLSVESVDNKLPKEQTTPSKNIWICHLCTMENPKSKSKCEACESSRSPSSSRSRRRKTP